jgi:hypothetical protein
MELLNIFNIIIIFFALFFIGCVHHLCIALGLLMYLMAFYKAGIFLCELKISPSIKYEEIIVNIDTSFFNVNTSFQNKKIILIRKKSILKGNNLLKLRSIIKIDPDDAITIRTYYDVISSINLFIGLTLFFLFIIVFLFYFEINFYAIILFLLPLYFGIFYFLLKYVMEKNKRIISNYVNSCQEILNKCQRITQKKIRI